VNGTAKKRKKLVKSIKINEKYIYYVVQSMYKKDEQHE